METITFKWLLQALTSIMHNVKDKRKGSNITHSMHDIVMSAFAVFYTQSPSFLHWQKTMQEEAGRNNAQTLFGIKNIPTDNHIRNMLDAVSPTTFYPAIQTIIENVLQRNDISSTYRVLEEGYLIALDGVHYHSSTKVYCPNCSHRKNNDESTTWYHHAITPTLVSPTQSRVLSLEPEFIIPQDGKEKQDCENAAAKRWLKGPGRTYAALGAVILGDDLYCNQPMCSLMNELGYWYILTCKHTSHKYLAEWVEALDPLIDAHEFKEKIHYGSGRYETRRYRYAEQVPLNGGPDALHVTYMEIYIIDIENNEHTFSYATNLKVSRENIGFLIECGRSRWMLENANNTLKTKGYHFEHNFGHGKEHLCNTLATLNILSFLMHTVLEFCDERIKFIRSSRPTRKDYYHDIRTLTTYMWFPSWDYMIDFMVAGLKGENKHILTNAERTLVRCDSG